MSPPQRQPISLDRLRVVLVATRNPLNLGAAARAMSNFGFGDLAVVNPYRLAFRDARSAVGATRVLADAQEYENVADAISDCGLVVGTTALRTRHLRHSLKRLEQGARLIRKQLAEGRVALLFGSEKVGLSNEEFSHCHWLLNIPTCEGNISMNLAQAVAVCLYELIREGRGTESFAVRRLQSQGVDAEGSDEGTGGTISGRTAEQITELLLEAMYASGYLKRKPTRDAQQRARRLIRRMKLPESDAAAWLGILRQILWKLNAS